MTSTHFLNKNALTTRVHCTKDLGFIRWDDDVNIGLPRDDYDKLESICRNALPVQHQWIDYKDNPRSLDHSGKVCDIRTRLIYTSHRRDYKVPLGVGIDMFPLDGAPSLLVLRSVHFAALVC